MKNSDQPAYPVENLKEFDATGFTKRELLAAMAMQSILESFGRGLPGPAGIVSNARGEPTTAGELYSEAAIGYADALLAELDKENVCEWKQVGLTYRTGCECTSVHEIDGKCCKFCGRRIKEVK